MRKSKTTMSGIAKLSGVSQSTVSLVLNQKGNRSIPPETVTRVLEAARELHYVKPQRTQAHRKAADRPVLVLVSDLTNPYYSFILHELELAAAPSGLSLICCNTYHQVEKETKFLETALNGDFFAAIFLYPPDNPKYVSQVNCQMPIIAICDKNAAPEIDLIELNNFQAGQIAAEHLLFLGHRNIAVLTSDPAHNLARSNRIQGVVRQIADCGLSDHLDIIVPDAEKVKEIPGNNAGYRVGRAIGQRPDLLSGKYTAFIAVNDMVAIGVIDALSMRGAQFPRDYSIVGFDNLLYTGLSRISLTTVDHHTDLLAQAAIELLLRRTNSSIDSSLLSSARFKVECKPQLVIRSSTAALTAPPHTGVS